MSAGVCAYEPGMESAEELIAAADRALYRAKARGGDCVVVWPGDESVRAASGATGATVGEPGRV